MCNIAEKKKMKMTPNQRECMVNQGIPLFYGAHADSWWANLICRSGTLTDYQTFAKADKSRE